MTFRFLSPAQRDLADAASYYDSVSSGLTLEFIDELEAAIGRILLNPLAWAKLDIYHRRCRLRRFPYGLIYSIEQDAVVISAVMHLHRHPDSWKNRP